jgi:Xaa-Pro aminopeptidase
VNVESVCTGGDLVSDTVKAVEGYCGGSARWGLTGLDVFPAAHYLRLADGLTGMAWEPADVILAEQRQIKSAAEIVALARAADVATAGLEAGLAAAVPAASRYQVELAVRRGCLEAGAELVHGVRVAAGASLQQQAPPIDSLSLLKEGDFVYLQVWGWVQGYAFNASRVQVIGSPSDQQQEYLQHLVEAAEWMVSSIKPDRRFTFYYAESRGREIYPRAHGIGLELAEAPWIRIQQSFVARQGMVFCVAPIVACRTFGRMSVSRTIVIEKNGPKTL